MSIRSVAENRSRIVCERQSQRLAADQDLAERASRVKPLHRGTVPLVRKQHPQHCRDHAHARDRVLGHGPDDVGGLESVAHHQAATRSQGQKSDPHPETECDAEDQQARLALAEVQ